MYSHTEQEAEILFQIICLQGSFVTIKTHDRHSSYVYIGCVEFERKVSGGILVKIWNDRSNRGKNDWNMAVFLKKIKTIEVDINRLTSPE